MSLSPNERKAVATAPDDDAPRVLRLGTWLLLPILLALSLARPARAVTVSPTALYIDARTRTGTITLFNPGSATEEIDISFAFGYPRSDSLGNVQVVLLDSVPQGEPSIVPFLRAFPRRLRLEPGQRQVVRILVQPPAGLAPGEFWGRILVTARGGQPPIEQQQGDVKMRLDLQTVIVTSVTYRNGPLTTGVHVTRAVATADSAGAHLLLDLARDGSSAFLGRIHAELIAPDGSRVAEATEDVAVYHALRRAVDIPLPNRSAALGGHAVRFTITTERPDLPPEGPLPARSVVGTAPLTY